MPVDNKTTKQDFYRIFVHVKDANNKQKVKFIIAKINHNYGKADKLLILDLLDYNTCTVC